MLSASRCSGNTRTWSLPSHGSAVFSASFILRQVSKVVAKVVTHKFRLQMQTVCIFIAVPAKAPRQRLNRLVWVIGLTSHCGWG